MATRQELRDKTAQAKDIRSELVHSKSWDIDVEIRGMSGEARADVVRTGYDDQGKLDYRTFYPALIAATVYVPGTDERVYDAADRDWLNSKSAAALEELAAPAMRLSGLEKDDLERAEKNSKPSPTSVTGST